VVLVMIFLRRNVKDVSAEEKYLSKFNKSYQETRTLTYSHCALESWCQHYFRFCNLDA